MQAYLAIDIGASSGRHLAGWLENGILRTKEVYRFENGLTEQNGHLCWDTEKIFAHILDGLRAAHAQGFTPVSVGIDTWGVDFVLLDGSDEPVGDAVAYRDSRTEGMDTLLERSLPFPAHYRLTGIAKQPFNTVYQMMAVLREHPEYRETVQDFLMMPEYLSFRLTGKKAHEFTILSTGALLDAAEHTFSKPVLEAAGLPEHWFRTPICQPGTLLGSLKKDIAEAVGFDCQVILPAAHDTGSAFMAVPAENDSSVFLSSGTWSLLGSELTTPVTGEESLQAGFSGEGGYNGTTRFLRNIMGLWMIQCLRNETDRQHSFAEMAEMAAASSYPAWIDAADNRFMAPPSMLEEVKKALAEQGAPAPNGLPDILRAVTVGLARCYHDSIRQLEVITGHRFTGINIVGGGCQNITLNTLTAQITGLPVLAGPTEGTALGNLGAQMITAGELAGLAAFRDVIRRSFDVLRYEP